MGYIIFITVTSVETRNEYSKALSAEVLQCYISFITLRGRTSHKEYISAENIRVIGNMQMYSFC